ncbi:MAG: tRNA lysidine(34) synthetase TilS [Thermodesulfobacteriota bacterium]
MSSTRNPINRRLRHKVIRTVHRHRMFAPGDRVLCGVSGGPDSVALVHVLHRLAPHFSIHLGIAHLNHQLRGKNAEADARFVKDLARTLNIAFYSTVENVAAHRRDLRLSTEEAARRVRYDFFDRICREHQYTKTALGHQADDNAEQVLMGLLRGSGKTGLSGIAPVRENRYVRPLIRLTRFQILEYLAAEGLAYRTDETNTDTRFLRNRVRHELIPLLSRDYNPNLSHNLNRMADLFRGEEAWIEEIITPLFQECLLREKKSEIHLSVSTLQALPAAPRRRVIRKAIERIKGDLRRITFTHIEETCHILDRPPGRRLNLPGGIRIITSGETLQIAGNPESFRPEAPAVKTPAFSRELPGVGTYALPEFGLRLRLSLLPKNLQPNFENAGQFTAFFDMGRIEFPLYVRNIHPGDRFRPLGMTGSQKLGKWFIDHKIPAGERTRFPLLLYKGKILWVMGHRTDEFAKVTVETQSVLKVELFLA